MARLILVRHPPVAKAWARRCYGQSDMGLSREGRAMLGPLADRLAALGPDLIVHSDMRRTRALAELLGRKAGIEPQTDARWRERDFGLWEGRSWDQIYRQTGDAMDGMITAAASFRPGETGETSANLVHRIKAALADLPRCGCAAIISHGGPIAAARHLIEGTDLADLAQWIIPPAKFIVIEGSRQQSGEQSRP